MMRLANSRNVHKEREEVSGTDVEALKGHAVTKPDPGLK